MNRKHGLAGTRAFRAWGGMMARCYNPKHLTYPNYGFRGITVCRRWHDPVAFAADMGQPAPGLQLDRVDNDGNYEPGNCRWVTPRQNSNNRRRTRFVTWNGERVALADWCRSHGKDFGLVALRLQRGWPEHAALTRPARAKRKEASC